MGAYIYYIPPLTHTPTPLCLTLPQLYSPIPILSMPLRPMPLGLFIMVHLCTHTSTHTSTHQAAAIPTHTHHQATRPATSTLKGLHAKNILEHNGLKLLYFSFAQFYNFFFFYKKGRKKKIEKQKKRLLSVLRVMHIFILFISYTSNKHFFYAHNKTIKKYNTFFYSLTPVKSILLMPNTKNKPIMY